MRHRDFAAFIWPSALAMLLFIALPIVSVAIQSLYVEHGQVMVTAQSCTPFSCVDETVVDTVATEAKRQAEPLGRFDGLGTYLNRAHLATAEIAAIFSENNGLGDIVARVMNLPFYKALAFTLLYTFLVTPLSMALGLAVALGVNRVHGALKGLAIFFSLLPYIVTPLLGSLILFWMIDANGVIGASLQWLFDDPELSLKASPLLTWVTLIVYGIWHMTPFAFVIFYAGLQTLPQDTLESAMIDGASRWERIRYVIMPHLAPLATFVGLVLLMDNFRVFEPIIGFSAEAQATSLSWLIYNDLTGQSNQLFGSAAATSILTMLGVIVLLLPVLLRARREFKRKAH